jgi:predicted Zn-ribbon and HTH transcriptional regulator
MAIFKCNKCGFEKEWRCKPRKCTECEKIWTFEKIEEGWSSCSK